KTPPRLGARSRTASRVGELVTASMFAYARLMFAARTLSVLLLLLSACSSSESSSSTESNGEAGPCPDLGGTWEVTAHCDPSLIGKNAVVTQASCSLSFAPPFNGFEGIVSNDGKVTLSGPQSCNGTAGAASI